VPVPGHRRLPRRDGEDTLRAQLSGRRPVVDRAVALRRTAIGDRGQPGTQPGQRCLQRQEDAGRRRLAEQTHRRRHPQEGDSATRQPAWRLGPRCRAWLEFRAEHWPEHRRAQRRPAGSAGDPAGSARPPAQEGWHRKAAWSGALFQSPVRHARVGHAPAGRRWQRAHRGRARQLRPAFARGDQPGRGQPQEAAEGDERRAAGADRVLGCRPRLRRAGVPLGVAGLSRQYRQRRRRATGSGPRQLRRTAQGRGAPHLRARGGRVRFRGGSGRHRGGAHAVNATPAGDALILAKSLTRRTEQLCVGLESGTSDVFDRGTPTTAELLHWWFGADAAQTRAIHFHSGQRQAILNTIVAHEVLGTLALKHLYEQVCAEALLTDGRLDEVSQPKHAHPKYCLKMATGTGKTWVLQALLVWQMLNKTAALDQGVDDPRFTRRFLIVAPGLIVYERLLDAFIGKEREGGGRDFSTSDTERYAELFVPPAYRERIRQFVQGNFCAKQDIGLKATGNGMVAVTNWHLLQETGAELVEAEAEEALLEAAGVVPDPHDVVRHVLPVAPGKATGNSLEVLDGRWA